MIHIHISRPTNAPREPYVLLKSAKLARYQENRIEGDQDQTQRENAAPADPLPSGILAAGAIAIERRQACEPANSEPDPRQTGHEPLPKRPQVEHR
jgi:hypothetical protein